MRGAEAGTKIYRKRATAVDATVAVRRGSVTAFTTNFAAVELPILSAAVRESALRKGRHQICICRCAGQTHRKRMAVSFLVEAAAMHAQWSDLQIDCCWRLSHLRQS